VSAAGGPEHQVSLEAERAVNERYLRAMEDMVSRQHLIAQRKATSRNQQWTNPGSDQSRTPVTGVTAAPLVGRVALGVDDQLLGDGFYIGSWHQEWDGVQIISWAAPVAALFYKGRLASDPLAHEVQASRTFVVGHTDIEDFVDDLEFGISTETSPFAPQADRPLAVPPPPTPSVPRETPGGPSHIDRLPHPPPGGAVSEPRARPTSLPAFPEQTVPAEQTPQNHERPTAVSAGHEIRAEAALRTVLERPKTGRLASVLGTLQPDQYRLVTWSDELPLVVQGSPGTGKTVVAAHRAAYLTHAERVPPPLARVAIIGPTDEYVHHVSEAIHDLDMNGQDIDALAAPRPKVAVLSLSRMLCDLAGLPSDRHLNDQGSTRLDTDWRLGFLTWRVATVLKREGALPTKKSKAVKSLVDAIARRDRRLHRVLSAEPDFEEWFGELGSYDQARTKQRFVPFLAAAGLALQAPTADQQFDHLICDEAQDIRPLEWRILESYRRDGRSMSLFGDINQRRSDWSYESWEKLAIDLQFTDEEGHFEPEFLKLGLRTTRQIVHFANRLLPAGQRTVNAIREGPDPITRKVHFDELVGVAIREAEIMSDKYEPGLVAVISVSPPAVSDALRKLGWTPAPNHQSGWKRRGGTILTIHPDQARGLEFDGVIVVEPASFAQNLGRHGQLYTSLTRAVHELFVVHAMALPRGLRSSSR
jgi:DNA helicase-2/ATP-dependent DNA helicase PcrA